MSELKTHDLVDIQDYRGEVYLKSEADKVIAELKNGIAPNQSDKTLQERLNEVCEKHGVSTLQDLDWAFCESGKRHTKDNIEAAKVIAHQKFKRCLKNREICVMRCDIEFARQYPTRASFWMKWERKWLELAEKFKEVK